MAGNRPTLTHLKPYLKQVEQFRHGFKKSPQNITGPTGNCNEVITRRIYMHIHKYKSTVVHQYSSREHGVKLCTAMFITVGSVQARPRQRKEKYTRLHETHHQTWQPGNMVSKQASKW